MKYSGFFKRLVAVIIDSMILIPLGAFLKGQFIVNGILALAYSVWMIGTYGATVGKMVMNLRVVKENGSKVNYSDALLREISKYLSGFVFGLGYLNVIWDKKKQGWHDKIAKTVVLIKK